MKKHSTIIAGLLALILSTGCGERGAGFETVTLTGSSTIAPLVADAARRYEETHPGIRIEVQSGGSSRGVVDAGSGVADLGMVSRALVPDEQKTLKAHRIATDGVCVILHRDNPVAGLDRQQLIDIYTKKTTNWSVLGGKDVPIVVANKAEGRSTLEVFLDFLDLDPADVKADVVVGENLHVINSVVGNPNTIGYVSIGTAASEAENGTPIKLIVIDGVAPSMRSVADGVFPITRPLNVVEDAQTPDAAAAFLRFLTSPDIHDLVEKHYFIPVH